MTKSRSTTARTATSSTTTKLTSRNWRKVVRNTNSPKPNKSFLIAKEWLLKKDSSALDIFRALSSCPEFKHLLSQGWGFLNLSDDELLCIVEEFRPNLRREAFAMLMDRPLTSKQLSRLLLSEQVDATQRHQAMEKLLKLEPKLDNLAKIYEKLFINHPYFCDPDDYKPETEVLLAECLLARGYDELELFRHFLTLDLKEAYRDQLYELMLSHDDDDGDWGGALSEEELMTIARVQKFSSQALTILLQCEAMHFQFGKDDLLLSAENCPDLIDKLKDYLVRQPRNAKLLHELVLSKSVFSETAAVQLLQIGTVNEEDIAIVSEHFPQVYSATIRDWMARSGDNFLHISILRRLLQGANSPWEDLAGLLISENWRKLRGKSCYIAWVEFNELLEILWEKRPAQGDQLLVALLEVLPDSELLYHEAFLNLGMKFPDSSQRIGKTALRLFLADPRHKMYEYWRPAIETYLQKLGAI